MMRNDERQYEKGIFDDMTRKMIKKIKIKIRMTGEAREVRSDEPYVEPYLSINQHQSV